MSDFAGGSSPYLTESEIEGTNEESEFTTEEEEEEEEEEEDLSPREVWDKFVDDGTIAGLASATHTRNAVIRWLWYLLILAALGYCGYILVVALVEFYDYELNSVFSVKYDTSGFRFPAVTICNQNPYNASAFKRRGRLTPEKDFASKFFYKSVDQFVKKCKFKKSSCKRSDWKKYQSHRFGNCFTFYPTGKRGMVTEAGDYNGIKMILQVNQADYPSPGTCYLGEECNHQIKSAGFVIATHNPHESPILDNTHRVRAGAMSYISLTKSSRITLPLPYTNCTTRKTYSYSNCRKQCISDHIFRKCKCRFSLFDKNSGPLCDSLKASAAMRKCYHKNYESYFINDLPGCRCVDRCETTTFQLQSSEMGPSQQFKRKALHHKRRFRSRRRKKKKKGRYKGIKQLEIDMLKNFDDYVFIDIFIGDLTVQSIEQEPKHTFSSIWGEVGGNWGMYTGFTAMTIVEFSKACGDLIVSIYRNRGKE